MTRKMLIKNLHTATVSLPSLRGFPEISIAPGTVAPISADHLDRLGDHPVIAAWIVGKLLKVIDPEREEADEVTAEGEPHADAPPAPTPDLPPVPGPITPEEKESAVASAAAAGDSLPPGLPPLPAPVAADVKGKPAKPGKGH